jgi:hypothetical protein
MNRVNGKVGEKKLAAALIMHVVLYFDSYIDMLTAEF